MNKSKGFTIIELIVVIAIIAVLATIVLVNVTQYINKGKDAAIKGNVATIITNAAVYFDDINGGNGDYIGFSAATNPLYTVPAAAITSAGKTTITGVTTTGDKFCVCATLFDTTLGTFCADSSGYKKATNVACATRCPATTGVCVD
jgi:prepilin-type N-terminal cleavage/methylation domain-containing protein